MRKKILLFMLVVCHIAYLLIQFCLAEESGTTGANFLKIGLGARAAGMGGAYVAVSDDIYSIYWNPAGLAELDNREVTFMHNTHFQDITQQFVGYAQPIDGEREKGLEYLNRGKMGVIGFSLNYLGIEDIEGYNADGESIGDLKTYDLAGILSYAKKMKYDESRGRMLSIGSNLKFIHQRLDSEKSTSYAIDLGCKYSMNIGKKGLSNDRLSLGIGVNNLGTKVKFDKDEGDLPLNTKIGVAYMSIIEGQPLIVAIDGNIPNDNGSYSSIGSEYWIIDMLGLRVGYTSKEDSGKGLRMGIGIKVGVFRLDYAFVPYEELGDTHRINLTIH